MRIDEAQRLVQSHYAALLRVGTKMPSDYSDCCSLATDGIACIAVVHDQLGVPPRRPVGILTRAGQGALNIVHAGPAKLLEPSHDFTRLAFAVDESEGDRLVVATSGGAIAVERILPGRIEQIAWQPGGERILVVLADLQTDTMTLAGATTAPRAGDTGAPGLVHDEAPGRRTMQIYDLSADCIAECINPAGTVWEADWCGRDTVIALWSADAGESGWYRPTLLSLDPFTGKHREQYRGHGQIGHLRGKPEGGLVAFVEGVASDRGIVAGVLTLLDPASGEVRQLDHLGLDVSSVRWRAGAGMHIAGLRGVETVVGDVDPEMGELKPIWSSSEATCGAFLPTARPGAPSEGLAIVEAPEQPPVVALLREGAATPLTAILPSPGRRFETHIFRWQALDGELIEGVLLCPLGANGALPLVIDVHGGPVWAWRPCWQARLRAGALLLSMGAAVLLPNPRGSLGRGLAFAGAVLGENGGMGGPEMGDFSAAIEALGQQGLVDVDRVGLTGSSYGGYIAAWLPKLLPSIAAAAPISPVADWFGQHLSSNMPALEEIFLGGRPAVIPDRYLARSPALSDKRTNAPTLIMAGELDRCVPITQALELYRALSEQGSRVELVTYPAEGHSVRGPAGYLDSAARVLAWMAQHLGLGMLPR